MTQPRSVETRNSPQAGAVAIKQLYATHFAGQQASVF
jgi:hypothetical protein